MLIDIRVVRRFALPVLGGALAVALAACGGGGGDDNGGNGGNGGQTPAATKPAASPEPPSSDLKLISLNTLFDKSELHGLAGEITITHDNQDAGIIHNVHVYEGEDADGEDEGMTELEAGPVVQTLELDLEAGDYFYVCDAHPATMYGTLIVE